MENIELELLDLKKIFNYVSESIIVTDKDLNVVLINSRALKIFDTTEEEILYKKITELVPVDYQEEIFETMQNDDDKYFEVFLKKIDSEL